MLKKLMQRGVKIWEDMKNSNIGEGAVNMVVTTAIIGTTATTGFAHTDELLSKARDVRRSMDMKQLHTALEIYYSDFGHYPLSHSGNEPTKNGWQDLYHEITVEQDGVGPWIIDLENDPLREEGYSYRYWSDGRQFKFEYYQEKTEDYKTYQSL